MKGVQDYRLLLSSADLAKGSSFEIAGVQAGKIQVRERGTGFFGKTVCWVQDQFHLRLSKRVLSDSQSAVYENVLADIDADETIDINLKKRAIHRLETLKKSGVPLRVRYLRNLARNLDTVGTGKINGNQYLKVERENEGGAGSKSKMLSISFTLVDTEELREVINEAVGNTKQYFDVHLKGGATDSSAISILEKHDQEVLLSDFTARVRLKMESMALANGTTKQRGVAAVSRSSIRWPAVRRLELDNIFREALVELRDDLVEMDADGSRTYKMVTDVTNRPIKDFGSRVDETLRALGKKCKTPLSTDDLFAMRNSWKAKVRAEVIEQMREAIPKLSDIVDGQMREVCNDFIQQNADKVELAPEPTGMGDSDNFYGFLRGTDETV